jgi:multidrug transporter EmrE-like cation transporter
MTNIVWLSLFSILLASGQLLFKRAAQTITGLPLSRMAATLAVSGPLWTALLLYGGSTLLWIWILSRIPLSQAYPWVALGSIIVPLAARLLFGEIVKPVFWLGALMIAAGIVVTQIGSSG